MAYHTGNIDDFHHGDYVAGPNAWDAARRASKIQQKFARRSRYGKSFGSLYSGYTQALLDDDQNRQHLYGNQMANRLNDRFYGRGRYRRRPSYRRRTYRRRRYRGRGLYVGGRGNYATRLKKLRKKISNTSRDLKTPLDQMLPGATALATMYNPAAGAAVSLGGAAASEALGVLEGSHNSKMAGRGLYVGGRGSYTAISGNSLIEGLGSTVPTFSTTDDNHGDLVVTHSEFVTDIVGNAWAIDNNNTMSPVSTFDIRTISLNPGLSKSFPFLSQIAQNFEEYEFIQMIFTYKPKVSNNLSSSDGQVGSIMMYTDYNANDEAKRSKQQILQAYGHSSDMITQNILHGVECDPSQLAGDGHHFIRVKPPSGNSSDYNDFDSGLFQIVVANTPEALSNQVIGELWVSYNVKLKKARTFSVYGLGLDRDEVVFPSITGGYGQQETSGILGAWNSIGAQYTFLSLQSLDRLGVEQWDPVAVNHAVLEIIIPQSFSGDLRITVTAIKKSDTSTEHFIGDIQRPVLQGNLEYLHVGPVTQYHTDVYGATPPPVGSESIMSYTNRSWYDIVGPSENFGAESGIRVLSPIYSQTLYVRAEMAERAIDNILWLGVPLSATANGECVVQMERYNARESSGPDPAFQE